MCFAISNSISQNQTAHKVSLVVDCLLVATMISLVCIVVIGKVDVGLGEVGTLSNRSIQAMIAMSVIIFVTDLVVLYCKNSQKGLRKQEEMTARHVLAEVSGMQRPPQGLSYLAISYSTKNKAYIFCRSDGKVLYKDASCDHLRDLPEEGITLSNGKRLKLDDSSDKRISIGEVMHLYREIDHQQVAETLKRCHQSLTSITYAPRLGIIVGKNRGSYFYKTLEMDDFASLPSQGIQFSEKVRITSKGKIEGESCKTY